MPAPLLDTKVHRPRLRTGLVSRHRLHERLDAGASARLLLVSAPAGFGKTTLIHVVLTTLMHDLAASEVDIVLVLDDYHLVDALEIRDSMAFLLDHLPRQLHLVIASRVDPPLSLARLRGRGELVEIRAAELRFTPEEAAAYLNDAVGLQLTPQDVTALEGRTEGWIVALQLAALSMRGRDDAAGFIAGFTGDDRYIVDYLVEEVLRRQPAPVRDFVLHTAVLGRLSGPLCDAVTGGGGGRATLDALDRGNLFVLPLDDRRQWYRYHHRRRFRPGRRPGGAGHGGHAQGQAGEHAAGMARAAARSGRRRSSCAQQRLRRCPARHR